MKNRTADRNANALSHRKDFTGFPSRGRSGFVRAWLVAFFVCGMAASGLASDLALARMTEVTLGDEGFRYTIVLTNLGTTNLETFWYAWLPGQDFMPVSPTNIQSPAGWTAVITGGNANNGYAIQWLTSSSATPAPLIPGASLSFSFDSTATPETLAGNSPFYASTPIGTSIVYSGGPFSDAGFQLVVISDLRPFFDGEFPVASNVYYLAFPDGTPFGFYTYLDDPHYIYHYDLGFEYILNAEDAAHGVYLYDFKSKGWFYTSPSFPFPCVYDFNLQTALYLFPDPNDPYRYSVDGVRYFYDFNTQTVITK